MDRNGDFYKAEYITTLLALALTDFLQRYLLCCEWCINADARCGTTPCWKGLVLASTWSKEPPRF